MIDSLLVFLGATGAQKQIDLGNLSVGLATLLLASVTIFIALRNSDRQNHHKIAEFRKEWIEEIRKLISTHCATSRKVSEIYVNEKDNDISDFFHIMFEIEHDLRLRLNPIDIESVNLIKLLVELRQLSSKGKLIKENSKENGHIFVNKYIEEMQFVRGKIIQISRSILKIEWERIKDEVHGKSFIARSFRRLRAKITRNRQTVWPDIADYMKEKGTN